MQPRSLVETIKERCRVCYTCVRECPAKAIRIETGQAEVIPDRCIGCGNCVRVCSQRAKRVLDSVETVSAMLEAARTGTGPKVAAIVAPSFPAEFTECDHQAVVGMLRALGFGLVCEVAFGADLVAERYRRMLASGESRRYIGTTCPALIAYVERYAPDMVGSLAPIVSPMIAEAWALRRMHGERLMIVFIGPCIAKKAEAASRWVRSGVDEVLTFKELRAMLADRGIAGEGAGCSEFDPPHGGLGTVFAISRGLLQAAETEEDLLSGEVVSAEGRTRFVQAIRDFESGDMDARLLEVLCCNGCIMGAGMSCDLSLFRRRSSVSRYARKRAAGFDAARWRADVERFSDLDLSRRFAAHDQRSPAPLDEDDIRYILSEMGKHGPEDELNCGACGYDTCREHALAIFKGLAENEMCLPHTIEQLRKAVKELAISHEQLASAQAALIQSEKMASMGQLAAGIAHEVNNPLGVVLMYAHLLLEGEPEDSKLREDLATVVQQADRCKKIVAGLLHFARQNKVTLERTDLRELIDQTIRAQRIAGNVDVRVRHELVSPEAEIDRDQMVQVLTNLVSNAQAAMPSGGALTIRTYEEDGRVSISVSDTGVGIPKENLNKVFEPFFSTKKIGEGTGLGLAVTYGIVKMHRGDIRVESNADPSAGPTGTTFTVTLPRHGGEDG